MSPREARTGRAAKSVEPQRYPEHRCDRHRKHAHGNVEGEALGEAGRPLRMVAGIDGVPDRLGIADATAARGRRSGPRHGRAENGNAGISAAADRRNALRTASPASSADHRV